MARKVADFGIDSMALASVQAGAAACRAVRTAARAFRRRRP
jgi:hypothetical protein